MSRQRKQPNTSISAGVANFEEQVFEILSILELLLVRLALRGLSVYGLYRVVLLALKQGG